MIKLDMMDKKKQSLKEIFVEALEYYKKLIKIQKILISFIH